MTRSISTARIFFMRRLRRKRKEPDRRVVLGECYGFRRLLISLRDLAAFICSYVIVSLRGRRSSTSATRLERSLVLAGVKA
ncbi:hypothetical protein B296_00052968 [Ensete ventricosum]|uniref:Uncharacterized protein n=1 Tax=Ensete ventricosum TaxID=4639 RepID=A0A426X473_ENSVE|nr:hypothetical protein B296_00052968 [Ensete ventricosum]